MNKAQSPGVKSLSLQAEGAFPVSVHLVPQQRMPQRRQMHPDLMGTPRLEPAFQKGIFVKALQYLIMGHRTLAVPFVHGHFFPVRGMSADGPVNDALVLLQRPAADGLISPCDGMFLQLLGDDPVGAGLRQL